MKKLCLRGHRRAGGNIRTYYRKSGPKTGKPITICVPCNRFRANEVRRNERETLNEVRRRNNADV